MTTTTSFRIRSYVPRGRRTDAQERAYQALWPQFGLAIENGMIAFADIFNRDAPVFLEPGFGSGQSLLELAVQQPQFNFIGVETHQPGIGALLMGIEARKITNLRIYHADVVDVLDQCIPGNSLQGIQIFFPDPWQKRRHHQRRLIQPEFIKRVLPKIKTNGILHLATDWADYAKEMMNVISAEPQLMNHAGIGKFSQERSSQRPVITKFEKRAISEGRQIFEIATSRI